nr:hypothetical protein [Tanacetum cinerariifolium]
KRWAGPLLGSRVRLEVGPALEPAPGLSLVAEPVRQSLARERRTE